MSDTSYWSRVSREALTRKATNTKRLNPQASKPPVAFKPWWPSNPQHTNTRGRNPHTTPRQRVNATRLPQRYPLRPASQHARRPEGHTRPRQRCLLTTRGRSRLRHLHRTRQAPARCHNQSRAQPCTPPPKHAPTTSPRTSICADGPVREGQEDDAHTSIDARRYQPLPREGPKHQLAKSPAVPLHPQTRAHH